MVQTVPILIGQLMIQSGMLESALHWRPFGADRGKKKVQVERGRIGEILLSSGLVSENELKAILVAVKMMRRSLITYDQAVDALKLVCKERYPYQAAFAKARWLYMCEHKQGLGKLLMDAEIIELEDLAWALASSIDETEVLGKSLIKNQKLEPRVRVAAIEAIILSKTGIITYKHAIAVLRASARTRSNIRDLIGLKEAPLKTIGREFVLSGKLLPQELADLVEETLETDRLWTSDPITFDELIVCLRQVLSWTVEQMEETRVPLNKARSSSEDLLLSTSSVLNDAGDSLPSLEFNPEMKSWLTKLELPFVRGASQAQQSLTVAQTGSEGLVNSAHYHG